MTDVKIAKGNFVLSSGRKVVVLFTEDLDDADVLEFVSLVAKNLTVAQRAQERKAMLGKPKLAVARSLPT